MTLKKVGRSKEAKARKQLTENEFFFYQNAGYSYDPKIQTEDQGHIESAKRYAKTEQSILERGLTFEWYDDPDGCIGCDCGSSDCDCASKRRHTCLVCVARDTEDQVVASLGSICEPSREYRRVIQAELAMEATV